MRSTRNSDISPTPGQEQQLRLQQQQALATTAVPSPNQRSFGRLQIGQQAICVDDNYPPVTKIANL